MEKQFAQWMEEECSQIGVTLSEKQMEQFFQYYEMLIQWNEVMNLTAITEMEDVYKRQDSILDRSPLFSGSIKGTGPRYCPSIEDKVVKFPDKERHQVFIEPEGLYTNEMYLGGMSSSCLLYTSSAHPERESSRHFHPPQRSSAGEARY